MALVVMSHINDSHDDDPPAQRDRHCNGSEGNKKDAEMEAILSDSARETALLRRTGLEDSKSDKQTGESGHPTPSGKCMGGWADCNHFTPKSMGGWSGFLPTPCWPPFLYLEFPPFPN